MASKQILERMMMYLGIYNRGRNAILEKEIKEYVSEIGNALAFLGLAGDFISKAKDFDELDRMIGHAWLPFQGNDVLGYNGFYKEKSMQKSVAKSVISLVKKKGLPARFPHSVMEFLSYMGIKVYKIFQGTQEKTKRAFLFFKKKYNEPYEEKIEKETKELLLELEAKAALL